MCRSYWRDEDLFRKRFLDHHQQCAHLGYHVGWSAAGARTRRVIERKLAFSLYGADLPQIALGEFLASGAYDAHLRNVRRLFQENLAHMACAIEASFPPETKMSRPAGGFVLWLELPRTKNPGVLS